MSVLMKTSQSNTLHLFEGGTILFSGLVEKLHKIIFLLTEISHYYFLPPSPIVPMAEQAFLK
jgi:hypothetical protein